MEERLQKIMSESGVCSRRAAEKLINDGRVSVNGSIAALGEKADREIDEISVDGKIINTAPEKVYIMLNKPRGYVTSMSDEKGRSTAAELVADCGTRVYPVGRLDMDSDGLLLFTNDGALTNQLLHPRGEINKVYRVWTRGNAKAGISMLQTMREIEGEAIRPAEISYAGEENGLAMIDITIHEGKNRQVRRMCSAAELSVRRLCRIQEGSLKLGDLEVGKWRYLNNSEIQTLKNEINN